MMRKSFAAGLIVLAALLPASALASPFDGEWVGEMVDREPHAGTCGFERKPFKVMVEDGEFVGEASTFGDTFQFEGEVDNDGRIRFWADWTVVQATTQQPTDASGKLIGKFSGNEFTATFSPGTNSSTAQSLCALDITLHRAGATATTAAVPAAVGFNGKWIGEIAVDVTQSSACGFRRMPVEAEVRSNRFASEVSLLGQTFALEGDVGDDGSIKFWADWSVVNAGNGMAVDASGKFNGKFSGHDFAATFSPQSSTGFFETVCPMKFTLRREGVPVASAAVAAQNQAAQAAAAELGLWQSVQGSQDAADLQRYLDRYPNGSFADIARVRLQSLSTATAQRAEMAVWNTAQADG